MPHLNGLQETYEQQGLSIVAVTSTREDQEKTQAWIEKRGVEYPVALDPEGELARWFGVRGIPHAVLIDPSGTIVWRGHPAQLPKEKLATVLEGALRTPVWDLEAVYEPFKNGKYAAALAAAEKSEGGKAFAAVLRERIEAKMEAVRRASEEGDFLGAQEMAERFAAELAGLPQAVTAAQIVTAIAQDPAAQKVISAQLRLRPLVEMVDQVKTMTAARELLAKLEAARDENPGTIVERRAKDAIDRLRQRMG